MHVGRDNRYKILHAPIEEHERLEQQVTEYLDKGWKLVGGLAARAYEEAVYDDITSKECTLFQAVYCPLSEGRGSE